MLTLLRNRVRVDLSREEIRCAQITFSQFGEDMAVARWVERQMPKSCIYVDAGCFHPIHFSNTLLLNKQGWKGVNIDMDEQKIARFRVLRPADHNVVAALGSSCCTKRMLRYQSGLTDRLGEVDDDQLTSVIGETPLSSAVTRTETLDNILTAAPFPVAEIGYLNVDCEGYDLEVLKGLSLDIYNPVIITIEAISNDDQKGVYEYLVERGYSHKETIYRTLVFVRV
jgi:hypothetical protein